MKIFSTISKHVLRQSGALPLQEHWFADEMVSRQISDLLQHGYVVVKNSLPGDLIESAIAAYATYKEYELMRHVKFLDNDAYESGKFRRLVNLHAAIPVLQELFSRNKALQIVDAMLGSPATLYTSLFFEIGSGQSLHRDTPYFWTNPAYGYFGVWVALDDTDAANGPLIVVPRSHVLADEVMRRQRIGLHELQHAGSIASDSPRLWENYQAEVTEQALSAGLAAQEVHVSKGDTIIWHPQLLHGGAPALDRNRSRMSVAMHVTPRDTRVAHQDLFFNPDVAWNGFKKCVYHSNHDRLIRRHKSISIAHKVKIKT